MSDQKGVFRFELNESLYFESGQEVAEIIGISLDPEISMQTFHEYVSIRGVIELTGDYYKIQLSNTLDNQPDGMNDYHEKNFIEQVIDKTDTHAAFTHRFPVEISIPSYRVDDLENVTVQISSFDYEIPNHHQMKIMATIEIEGINEGVPVSDDTQSIPPAEKDSDVREETRETPFDRLEEAKHDVKDEEPREITYKKQDELLDETSARVEVTPEVMRETKDVTLTDIPADNKDTEMEEEMHDNRDEVIEKPEESNVTFEESLPEKEMEELVEESEHTQEENAEEKEELKTEPETKKSEPERKKQNKSKKSLPLSDFFKYSEEKNTEGSLTMEEDVENEATDTLELEDTEEDMEDTEETEETEEIIKTNEMGKENEKNSAPIDSLSEMFEHDKEDKYAKMRLCIVQDSDTIDEIAERYEITTNQLMLKNHLDEDTIKEGQLLFIPEKISK